MLISWDELWSGRSNCFGHPNPNPIYNEEFQKENISWKWLERHIPSTNEIKGVHCSVIKFPE